MNDDEQRAVIQTWLDVGSPTCASPNHPRGVSRVVLPRQTCPHCSQRLKLGGK